MLVKLSIQNYALIDQLDIELDKGFSIITGETGAGKSILLGALSLLLGQRADSSVQLNKEKKCVVEAEFSIKEYKLNPFFDENQLEYSDLLIVRREIIDNGRTRAFINDTPVNAGLLKELGDRLIDIHSQHQSLYLGDIQFQFKFVDSLAKNTEILNKYKESLKKYKRQTTELEALTEKARLAANEKEFLQFQFEELEKVKLKNGEQIQLEEEHETLSHSEEIKTLLGNSFTLLNDDETGILLKSKELTTLLTKLKAIYHKSESLNDRLNSVYIELKDIASEIEHQFEKIEHNPERLIEIKTRLDIIYALCQKHKLANADELITLKDSLLARLNDIASYDEQIAELTKSIANEKQWLLMLSNELHQSRVRIVGETEKQINEIIHQLGMPNGSFNIQIETIAEFTPTGTDKISLLFTANKQVQPQDIAKVASGGEISRVMLAIKSVIASSTALPTIILDEIDTGVSGDIAGKMGSIMKQMASNLQVISITHLPQVAAKGDCHFKVYKTETTSTTNTQIKLLTKEERVTELAKMLSGEQVTPAAISNAMELLKN